MKRARSKLGIGPPAPPASMPNEKAFEEIVGMIELSRQRAAQTVNAILVDLYWNVGEYISCKIQADGGKGTVDSLSAYVQRKQPGIRGFSPQNLWRMRQFHETYRGMANLSTLFEIITLVLPSPHSEPGEVARGAGVLSSTRGSQPMAGARGCPTDGFGTLRADGASSSKTLTSVERIASAGGVGLPGCLLP